MGRPTEQFLTTEMKRTMNQLALKAYAELETAYKEGDQPKQMYWTGYIRCIHHLHEAKDE